MYLPSPSNVSTVSSNYHIVTFGAQDSGTYVVTVMWDGACRDSYVVVGNPEIHTNYISLPFER